MRSSRFLCHTVRTLFDGFRDSPDSMNVRPPPGPGTDSARDRDEQRWSALMARAQAGDNVAYNQLLQELGRVLENYLRRHFGALLMLEDCVQECLLAIHRARHTYDPCRPFRPWMFTIARHKTIDLLRRADTMQRGTDAMIQEWELQGKENDSRRELERMLDGARLLQQIPVDQREAIALTQYLGLTSLEAARRVGIKESALKARLRRGLKTLQQHWQGDSEYHEC